MELLKSEAGNEKLAELHKADWSATTQLSTVRRFVTNKKQKLIFFDE